MKSAIILAIACISRDVFAKYKAHVTYSRDLVNVGDLDVFGTTWTKIYAEPGNQNSVLLHEEAQSQSNPCHSLGNSADTRVSIDIEGQWGRDPGLGIHDAREAIVQAYWDFAKAIMAEYSTPIWTNCFYPVTRGPNNPTWYPATPACSGAGCVGCQNNGAVRCQRGSTGHKVPAKIKVTLTDSAGQLMADGMTVSFKANKPQSNDGCTAATKVAGGLSALIPGLGTFFSAGITVACESIA